MHVLDGCGNSWSPHHVRLHPGGQDPGCSAARPRKAVQTTLDTAIDFILSWTAEKTGQQRGANIPLTGDVPQSPNFLRRISISLAG
jgi:hypothetical protein